MGKTLPNISFKVIYITNIKEFSLNLALMGFFEIDIQSHVKSSHNLGYMVKIDKNNIFYMM